MTESPKKQPVEKSNETPGLTGRQAYNVVTDTVGGANVRWKDNLYQGIAILVCLLLGGVIGALVVEEWIPGALVGAFIGLVVGLLGSGFFLAVYRALAHLRGRHD